MQQSSHFLHPSHRPHRPHLPNLNLQLSPHIQLYPPVHFFNTERTYELTFPAFCIGSFGTYLATAIRQNFKSPYFQRLLGFPIDLTFYPQGSSSHQYRLRNPHYHPIPIMSDISSLSTPTPEPSASPGDIVTPHEYNQIEEHDELDPKFLSPPPPALSEMTPPPSSQMPTSLARSSQIESCSHTSNIQGSSPPTLKWGHSVFSSGLFGEMPTVEAVHDYTEEQLRGLVAELLPALGEARMSAAHAKLQYSLLSIENAESMKRAEVEHEMTRREVQVLKESMNVQVGGRKPVSSPCSPQPATQRHLDMALKHCREMQADKAILDRRLRRAKKLILRLDGKNTNLTEEIQLLRLRIKQNRDHFNAMRSSGVISVSGTPVNELGTSFRGTPRTPHTSQTPLGATSHVGSQDPFDALLFAGQVLNEETNSVPSTPSQPKPRKPLSSHIRGAHSLSSLPATPDHSRPITADGSKLVPMLRHARERRPGYFKPSTQTNVLDGDRRHERDSTISASDNDDEDEAYTDVDIPASQASQRATNMLRLIPSGRHDGTASSKNLQASRKLSQSRILGQLKKDAVDNSEHRKRGRDTNTYDEISRANKKAKMLDGYPDRIGLGIANWPNPKR